MKLFLMLAGALLLAGYTHAAPVHYTLSGRLVYQGSYPLGTWQGTNTAVTGQLAGDAPGGSLTGVVQATVAAWESGNNVRDQHTRAMFDAEHHPTARFVVTELKAHRAGDPAILRGALTLHGVTRTLDIPGKLTMDAKRLVFDSEIPMRLSDYELTPPVLMGMKVANDVKLMIHAEGTTP